MTETNTPEGITEVAAPEAEQKEWQLIPDATKNEINVQGAIRKVAKKAPLFTDKDHNILLMRDSTKKLDTFNSTALVKELFGVNIPTEGNERENPIKKTTSTAQKQNTMSTKKATIKKSAPAKKVVEPKVKKESKALTATAGKVIADKEMSQSDKIRNLNKQGYSRSEIASALGIIYQSVRGVLVRDEEAKKGK